MSHRGTIKSRKAARRKKRGFKERTPKSGVKNVGSLSDIARKRVAATRPGAKAAARKAATPSGEAAPGSIRQSTTPQGFGPQRGAAQTGRVSLTQAQVDAIKSGKVKAPAASMEAVRTGNFDLTKEPLIGGREKAALGAFATAHAIPAAVGLAGGAIGSAIAGRGLSLGKAGSVGGAGPRELLTNQYWKGANAARATRAASSAAAKLDTSIGTLTKNAVGEVSSTQVNSKVRRLIGGIFQKVFGSTTTQTFIDPALV